MGAHDVPSRQEPSRATGRHMTDLARSAGGGSATVAGRRLPDRDLDPPGLSEAEAERKLAAERRPRRTETSRSYSQHRPGQRPDGVQPHPGRLRDADVDLRGCARRSVPRHHRGQLDDRDRPGGAGEAGTRSPIAAGCAVGEGEPRWSPSRACRPRWGSSRRQDASDVLSDVDEISLRAARQASVGQAAVLSRAANPCLVRRRPGPRGFQPGP